MYCRGVRVTHAFTHAMNYRCLHTWTVCADAFTQAWGRYRHSSIGHRAAGIGYKGFGFGIGIGPCIGVGSLQSALIKSGLTKPDFAEYCTYGILLK